MALSSAERQRRYIERLKARAASALVTTAEPVSAAVDEARRLGEALNKVEYLTADRGRWYNDCLKAEAEWKQEELRHRNTRKDKIVLQQEVAALKDEIARLQSDKKYVALRRERDALADQLEAVKSYDPGALSKAIEWTRTH